MSRLINVPRQIVRGCTNLPYVGAHPGTSLFFLMVGVSAATGILARGLVTDLLIGTLAATFSFGALHSIGAWSRAEHSDRLCRRAKIDRLLQDWVNTLPEEDLPPTHIGINAPDRRSVRIGLNRSDARGTRRVHAWRDNPPYEPALPDWIIDRIDAILTDRRGGKPRRKPSARELKILTYRPMALSAHKTLEAHKRLGENREKS